MTKGADNARYNARLNAAGTRVRINRSVGPGCVRSVELSSVAPQAQMESEERDGKGRDRGAVREREGESESGSEMVRQRKTDTSERWRGW